MPITLGILAQSRQVVAASDFVLLETQVLGSSAASVTFSGLSAYSSTYKHLQIRVAGSAANTAQWMNLGFNGVTAGSSYYSHFLRGTGSAVNSFASGGEGLGMPYLMKFQTNPSVAVIDILDAFSTTKNKTVRALTGNATAETFGAPISLYSGLFISTSAATSLELYASSTTFTIGSRFSLYGVK